MYVAFVCIWLLLKRDLVYAFCLLTLGSLHIYRLVKLNCPKSLNYFHCSKLFILKELTFVALPVSMMSDTYPLKCAAN